MLIAGLDEAGRGAVVGPMFICGVSIEENKIGKLKELGVKDSKLLSPWKRQELYPKIKKLVKYHLIKITAQEIDMLRSVSNLNRLEARKFAEIIDKLNPNKVIVDAPEVNLRKYEGMIRKYLKNKEVELVVENYADKKYTIVGAASIIAKVNRDKSIKELEQKLGKKIGRGYSGDPITIKFLKELIREGKLPEYIRKSWITTKEILSKKEQKNLVFFLNK